MEQILKQTLLTQVAIDQLCQLGELTEKLGVKRYNMQIDALENETIGRHLRHILEFYGILIEAMTAGTVLCYDERKRDHKLENDLRYAQHVIQDLSEKLLKVSTTGTIQLRARYAGELVQFETNGARELLYTIEHTVHHMAIIRIAVKTSFPEIDLGDRFGYSDSTQRFKKAQQV